MVLLEVYCQTLNPDTLYPGTPCCTGVPGPGTDLNPKPLALTLILTLPLSPTIILSLTLALTVNPALILTSTQAPRAVLESLALALPQTPDSLHLS